MSKGLNIARAFYRAGHHVIGADFEPYCIPVCGHFSKSIRKFYRMHKPSEKPGAAGSYIRNIAHIIEKENVELWVSCSGVASEIEDGVAAELVELRTNCVAVQFRAELTEMLHEKYSFIKHTTDSGLNVPLTYRVLSVKDALTILHPRDGPMADMLFIMKPEMVDDSVRGNMTLLPLRSRKETDTHVRSLKPSFRRPFVLQQYVSGREYCTHSIVLKGKIHAFVTCRSSDMLMHYKALPPSSALSQAMLHYTTTYIQKTSRLIPINGHFSLDFLIDEGIADVQERILRATDSEIEKLQNSLFPIECNPRAHTAVVLLNDQAEKMADAYLTLLPGYESSCKLVVPTPDTVNTGYYWIGHDLVTKGLLPILELIAFQNGIFNLLTEWIEFGEHLLLWKDGTHEIWDPWPAWCLYVLFLPGNFCLSIWERKWWSRCNVSTGKFFGI